MKCGIAKCGCCGKSLVGQDAKYGHFTYYFCGTLLKKGVGNDLEYILRRIVSVSREGNGQSIGPDGQREAPQGGVCINRSVNPGSPVKIMRRVM